MAPDNSTNRVKAGTVRVNGTEIYHEIRGSGPSVSSSRRAHGTRAFTSRWRRSWPRVTVVAYDRRANFRSPWPEGYATTSVQQHADDAAGLSRRSVLPCTGRGLRLERRAITLLDLIVRRPDLVRGALVHEPAIIGVLPTRRRSALSFRQWWSRGSHGRPARRDRTLRQGRPGRRDLRGDRRRGPGAPPWQRRSLLRGRDAALRHLRARRRLNRGCEGPGHPARGRQQPRDLPAHTTQWLADRVGAAIVEIPGRHAGFADHPQRWRRSFARSLGAELTVETGRGRRLQGI